MRSSAGRGQRRTLVLVWSALALGCTGTIAEPAPVECEVNRPYFEQRLAPLAAVTCQNCHTAEGQARYTRFLLARGDSPEAIAQNFAAFSDIARIRLQGTSVLLLKPTGQVAHGGGMQVAPGTPEFEVLAGWVRRVESCAARCEPTRTPARVRRLTRAEYNRTVEALVGDASKPADAFAIEDRVNGYSNNASALQVSPLLSEQLQTAAASIAERAAPELVGGCDPAQRGEETCARELIAHFGRRAFRRPLSAQEEDELYAVYLAGREGASFQDGIQLVVEASLQAGSFLYNTELGDPSEPGEVVRLTSYELASELSYLATGGPPDEALTAAAEGGRLSTPDEREAELRRLLRLPGARAQLQSFVFQWLQLDGLDQLEKDPELFPQFGSELRAAMRGETERFVEQVLFEGDARLKTLLTSNQSFIDEHLAALYGVEPPPPGSFARVMLDPAERAGLLTQPSLLATFAGPFDASPVRRGKLVRTRLLCEGLPPPPKDLMISFPGREEAKTTRQRFAQHAQNAACSGCHALMDPIGFGLEQYDALGAYQTTEGGEPLSGAGELVVTRDVDGPFRGAVELAHRLAESEAVRECFTRHLHQFALARTIDLADECSLRSSYERFARSDTDVLDLLVGIVRSDAFVLRKVTP